MSFELHLSNRETIKLLKKWGFQPRRGNGGHLVLEKDGKRLQVTAPGRSTKNTYAVIKKAADICSVSVHELVHGPKGGKDAKR